MLGIENLAQRHTQHLTTLVEYRLHHPLEQLFVTTQMLHIITRHPYDGAHHLGRWIKHGGLNGKQILYVIPRLNQYRQNAILFVAGLRSHTYCHLMLYHTRTTGNEVTVVKHLEEYLRRDIIRVVARQHKLLTAKHLTQIHMQKVFAKYILP